MCLLSLAPSATLRAVVSEAPGEIPAVFEEVAFARRPVETFEVDPSDVPLFTSRQRSIGDTSTISTNATFVMPAALAADPAVNFLGGLHVTLFQQGYYAIRHEIYNSRS